jgi:hypothetical protein
MMTESIELLGKGLYKDIPNTLTLKAFPTVTELDYVGSEDFERTMLEKIFPQCIEEKVNFHKLLEIDFQWICRCMRFLNYGPYFTTNVLLCSNCGTVRTEAQVDLRTVGCKPLPEGFNGDIIIKKDELIDYKHDIHVHLLTIQEALDMRKDSMFVKANGDPNTEYARVCYSISSMGNQTDITPVTAKLEIEKNMSPADFKVLKSVIADLTDYGLRGGGRCQCPQCKQNTGAFIALADDRFFRPTVGDLRKGKNDRGVWRIEDAAGNTTEIV